MLLLRECEAVSRGAGWLCKNLYKFPVNINASVLNAVCLIENACRRMHRGVNTKAGECTLERSCVFSKCTLKFGVFFNAVCWLQMQVRMCMYHDHDIWLEQFSKIYRQYGIRKSIQMLIAGASLQTSKLWQMSEITW